MTVPPSGEAERARGTARLSLHTPVLPKPSKRERNKRLLPGAAVSREKRRPAEVTLEQQGTRLLPAAPAPRASVLGAAGAEELGCAGDADGGSPTDTPRLAEAGSLVRGPQRSRGRGLKAARVRGPEARVRPGGSSAAAARPAVPGRTRCLTGRGSQVSPVPGLAGLLHGGRSKGKAAGGPSTAPPCAGPRRCAVSSPEGASQRPERRSHGGPSRKAAHSGRGENWATN